MRERTDHLVPYADVLTKTSCDESIEATIRKRRLRCAGFVSRMGDIRVPEIALLGENCGGGLRYPGVQEFD